MDKCWWMSECPYGNPNGYGKWSKMFGNPPGPLSMSLRLYHYGVRPPKKGIGNGHEMYKKLVWPAGRTDEEIKAHHEANYNG